MQSYIEAHFRHDPDDELISSSIMVTALNAVKNLKDGGASDVLDHVIELAADFYTPVGAGGSEPRGAQCSMHATRHNSPATS